MTPGPSAPLVLAVNPGAGSTKLALYRGGEALREERLAHPDLLERPRERVWDELRARVAAVEGFLAAAGVGRPLQPRGRGESEGPPLQPGGRGESEGTALAAVAGRGGLLPPLPSGTFEVNAAMLADLEAAVRGEHASNLGAAIARAVGDAHGCPAFVVDPVSVDELEPVARVTGLAGVERRSFSHALNMRAVARRFASEAGRPLAELRLVVCHMGTGVSLSAQRDGRMVDVVNPQDEGPFSGDRAGGVPATALVELCFAAGADAASVRRRLFGDGGLFSLLGTRDAREAVARAGAGDAAAALVLDAMAYQIAKAAAAMAAALEGRVDAILLTGGMAHLAPVVDAVRRRVAWIAPVRVLPGEDELRALAEGALRVLRGEEPARRYAPGAR
ncbi:MAG TPA: butyrate kinase [Anaeromyxobacteraceae bacterium]|nr:butyrate kinase [Anaeromyxobacteraceae bacterium]